MDIRIQLYNLDDWCNAIQFIELHCENVDAAREHAALFVDEHPVELWNGPTRIACFTPSDED